MKIDPRFKYRHITTLADNVLTYALYTLSNGAFFWTGMYDLLPADKDHVAKEIVKRSQCQKSML